MDVLAHGLWTNIMYKVIPQTRNNCRTTLWGIAFGVLPDLVSFAPFFLYYLYRILFTGQKFIFGPPAFPDNPLFKYASESYNYTHSFVIWLAVAVVVWLFLKRFPWILLGWALHIFIDIFTHTEEFFATPFLFPLSDFKVSVISWG
ncbi:MAG TPA: metal-dependent hydrolase, partial [Verrucomicrobiae bacterium]|nr:metal-dependent hydrolase [Verrucomicrobiae bacterium]